jgi:hypothetical protein
VTADFIPRDYQAAGIDLIRREDGVLLAYEPGSGKTVTAMTALKPPYLVVAPKMVAQEVWTREAAKWAHTAHLRVCLFDASFFDYRQKVTASAILGTESREIVRPGTEDDQDFLFCADVVIDRYELIPGVKSEDILALESDIYVVSRDHLYALAKILGSKWPWRTVLIDESTMFKNHEAKRSQTLWYLRRKKLVTKVVLMSGTPSPKNLENLWSQVRLLDLGKRLGEHLGDFRKKYMLPGAQRKKNGRLITYDWVDRPGAREEVTGKISDICLAVRAEVWRKTEPPLTVQRLVDIPREQYDQMQRELYLELGDGEITANQAAVLTNKLLQMASGAVLDTEKKWHLVHDAKLDALEELIEDLDGEPLMVMYWFKSTLARLKTRFPRIVTTNTKGFLDQFAAGKIPLLAIQPGSAGHGLDGLQNGGHHIAVMDCFHDWEVYQQTVSRLDRSGQQHRVTVHQILAADTKDEEVAPVLADRGANQAMVLEALKFTA